MSYTVNISLPKQLADLAKKQVAKGHYSSLSEVIRTALREFLTKPDVPVYKMSKKAERIAKKALEDYRNGKAIPLDSVEDLDRL